MKQPLLNEHERFEMQFNCLQTSLNKLKLAIMHFFREMHREIEIFFKL